MKMEDFIRIFRSSQGDIYHITLSEDNNILSSDAIDALKDVTLIGIDLRRFAIIAILLTLYQERQKTQCHLRNTEAVCLKGGTVSPCEHKMKQGSELILVGNHGLPTSYADQGFPERV